MSENHKPKPLLKADAIKKLPEQTFSHSLNPNSEISGVFLGEQVGLQRLGFHLVRIPPGKESFIYHSHEFEEEFIYILSGHGIAEIDEQEFEVEAGDFMGFPTPSVAHHLRNPFHEDLVYIMGGERREFEIADFPRLKKRIFRNRNQVQIADWDDLKPFKG
ncbi:MAG: cupin domain-containing protein [Scytonema sp. RU_4_4]|nr:cupin domain-containing protein [Scytonema sp. RU_4_4]NJR74229.1 cupin domain-containing protein [Scytonema sp. CRU_2_7]